MEETGSVFRLAHVVGGLARHEAVVHSRPRREGQHRPRTVFAERVLGEVDAVVVAGRVVVTPLIEAPAELDGALGVGPHATPELEGLPESGRHRLSGLLQGARRTC